MTGKVSVDNAFGQVLICLRMSELNYVVKETPFSAYVTIRKKFVKSVEGGKVEKVEVIDNLKKVDSDDHRFKALESECRLLVFQKEALEKEKEVLNDQFQEAFTRNRVLIKSNEELSQENTEVKNELTNTSKKLSRDISDMKDEKESVRKQFENYRKAEKKELLDKSDLINILENTLENRKSEIERLKEELDKAFEKSSIKEKNNTNKSNDVKNDNADDQDSDCDIATTSTKKDLMCKQCGEVVSSESGMESHIRDDHEWKCDHCGIIESTAVELEQHELEKHELECEHCDFKTYMEVDFDKHMEEKHGTNKRPYICDTCELTFRTKDIVMVHICKINLNNPTFKTLYTKNWYNANGCNALYCTRKSRDVAWLHSEKCWNNDVSCFWPGSLAKNAVKHFEMAKIINNGELCWPTIFKELEHNTQM